MALNQLYVLAVRVEVVSFQVAIQYFSFSDD